MTNLTKFDQNTFKYEHETEGLHQMKLETDSQNEFTSSNTYLNEP
jgi:hypothetical protein